ncbi:MAG: DUF445 family protein [Spirochaetaceae bacterium]|jgi:uncharacterized membrane protein YheB (UPF0754 family)|nr:DUF445 family protein [Spirochaetaceae bacterium]
MAISILLVAVAGGAAVGWITNALAVSMLFRKYWKWGGFIEARYEEFIENMSQLVEADLVNHKTLENEFNGQAFKAVLRTWIEDILRKELPEKSGNLRFEDLPGIEETAEQIIALIRRTEPEVLEGIYLIFKQKPLTEIFSKEQYYYLTNLAVSAVCSAAHRRDAESSLQALAAGLSDSALEKIAGNICGETTLDALYQFLIGGALKELESALKGMKYADFIKDAKGFSRESAARLVGFAESPEGQTLLKEVTAALFAEAKRIRQKPSDAVKPEVPAGIVRLIRRKFPESLNLIADLVDENREEINEIINDAVNRHLETSIDGRLLIGIKEFFIGDVAEKYNIVDKISEEIRKYGATAKDGLVRKAVFFMDNAMGNSIDTLRTRKIFAPLIRRNLPALTAKGIESLVSATIEKFDSPQAFADRIFAKLKREDLSQQAFKKYLQSLVADGINPSKIFLLERIPQLEHPLKKILLKRWENISAKKIGEFFSMEALQNVRIPWERIWERHKRRRVNEVYQGMQKESVYAAITEGLLRFITRHLESIVSGNVSKLVNAELKKSNSEQIRRMVQDFIGKELKPINVFGAFLGAIAGGLSVFGSYLFNVPREFIWQMLLIYGLIFAVVGIGTNWIAIKMLFRPYKKTLFFIGVVPARKPEFARNIASFVKNKTFKDEPLNLFFSKNKPKLQKEICQKIAYSDYALVDTLLRDKSLLSSLETYVIGSGGSGAESIAKLFLHNTQVSEYLRDHILRKLQESGTATCLYAFLAKEIEGKNLGDLRSSATFTALFTSFAVKLTPENVKGFLAKKNDWFITYISSHTFEDLAGSDAVNKGVLSIFEKMLQNIPRSFATYLKSKVFNPETKLKELFGGKLAGFIADHIPYAVDLLTAAIKPQKGALAKQIADSLPWYGGAVKPHIAPIVDILIDEELPKFLKQKKTALLSIADYLLELRLADIGFKAESVKSEVIEQILTDVLKAPYVQKSALRFAQTVAEQYTKIPLKSALAFLGITSIQDLITTIEPLLDSAVLYIGSQIRREDASALFEEIPLSKLFEGIDLEKEIQGITASLFHAPAFSDLLLYILSDIAQNYDETHLRKALADIADAAGGPESLYRAFIPLLETFFQNLNQTIAPETKQAICEEYLIPAALDAGEGRFKNILHSIDIQNVVEREVNAMHPAKVEKLFYKFAGTYFRRIILYGWIGLFGGLLSYSIGCLFNIF